MKSFLFIAVLSLSFAAHTEDASDNEREAIIASSPDLAKIITDKGACGSANAKKLSEKYISRGSNLDKDQDLPGSRVWRFSNLENDLALSAKDNHADPSSGCLDALASAGIKEQIKFWKIRKSTDCNEQTDKALCEKAEDELKWAAGESARLKAAVNGVIKRVADAIKKPTSKLEACVTCAVPTDLLTSIKAVKDQTRAAECCSLFKKRDGDMSSAKCEELHSATKKFTDSVAADCFEHIAKGFITGIMSQVKGLLWDLPKSIFNGSFLAGAGTLIHELINDPGKGVELLVSSLGRSMGIDPAYSDCLDESQRAKYRCDVGGNMLSQVAMLAGGWAKVFQVISKGTKFAGELAGIKKAADTTRAASDLTEAAATTRSLKEMKAAASELKSTKIKASNVIIDDPEIAKLTESIRRLKVVRSQLEEELKTAKPSEQPKIKTEIDKVDQHIAIAVDSIPKLIVTETSVVSNEAQAVIAAKTAAARDLPAYLKQKMTDYSDFVKQSLKIRKSIKEVKETVRTAQKEEMAFAKELKKAKKASDTAAVDTLKEKVFESKVKVLKQKFLQEKLEDARVTHLKFLRNWISKNQRIAPAAALTAAEASLHAEEAQHYRDSAQIPATSESDVLEDTNASPTSAKAPAPPHPPPAASAPASAPATPATQNTNVEDSD